MIKSDLDSKEQRGWKTEPRRTLGRDMQIKPRDHFFAGWGLESIFEVGGAAKPGRGGAIQKASQQSAALPSKPRGGSLSSVGVPLATQSRGGPSECSTRDFKWKRGLYPAFKSQSIDAVSTLSFWSLNRIPGVELGTP